MVILVPIVLSLGQEHGNQSYVDLWGVIIARTIFDDHNLLVSKGFPEIQHNPTNMVNTTKSSQ